MSKLSKVFAVISLMTVGAVAHSADFLTPMATPDNKSFWAGPLIGANFPTGSFGSNISPVFGLTVGGKLHPHFGLGFYGTYNGQSSSGSFLGLSTGSQVNHFVLMGDVNFYASVVHLGVTAGAEINTWSAGAGPVSLGSSNYGFIFGPKLGVDIPLGTLVSIGADVRYLLTTLQNAQGNVVASANVKFWF